MLPFYENLEKWLDTARDKSGSDPDPLPIAIFGLVVLFAFLIFIPGLLAAALSMALFLSPLWLPLLLVHEAWGQWMTYRRSSFIASQQMVLLEIIPPRSIEKTPLAMEAFLSGIHLSPGESTWWKMYVDGSVRPWWSLELVSIEGRVHFYIQTRVGFRRQVESQIYAQYPGAQVVEAEDYTRQISDDQNEWSAWGCDFKKKEPDPYPIKTYIDYGLDKVAKEPEQVDPLANLVEFMGSIGKGEQLWAQIMIRVHKGEKYHKKNAIGKAYTWKDEAIELVETIRALTTKKMRDPVSGITFEGFPNPTKQQTEKMAVIERNVSKLAFDAGIRAIYLAHPQNFVGTTIPALGGMWKQFNSEGFNSLNWTRWMTIYNDYPWEIHVEKRKAKTRRDMVDAYRRRSYFYPPYETPHNVMSIEELATIFHIPSGAVTTPTLPRIQSATGEAPPGLPV